MKDPLASTNPINQYKKLLEGNVLFEYLSVYFSKKGRKSKSELKNTLLTINLFIL
jgi:hypothetical protein